MGIKEKIKAKKEEIEEDKKKKEKIKKEMRDIAEIAGKNRVTVENKQYRIAWNPYLKEVRITMVDTKKQIIVLYLTEDWKISKYDWEEGIDLELEELLNFIQQEEGLEIKFS